MAQKKKIAVKADPDLWKHARALALEKMGGKFSARAMQEAVRIYKKLGGTYRGEKSVHNSLVKWTKEDWNYAGEPGHSRYLPKEARAHLTRGEKIATDRAKNAGTKKGKQWVPQPPRIAKKTSRYRLDD